MNNKKIRLADVLAYVYIIICLVSTGFNNTQITLPTIFQRLLTLLTITIGMFVLIEARYSLKFLIVYVPILLIGILSYIYTKTSIVLLIVLGIVILKDINIQNIILTFCIVRTITILLIIVSALFGIIRNNYVQVSKAGSYVVARYCLGYDHPNQLAEALGTLLLGISVLFFNSKKISKGIALVLFSLLASIIYFLTSSRAFLMCSIFVVVIQFLSLINVTKVLRFIKKYSLLCIFIILFLGLVLPFTFKNSSGLLQTILYKVNSLMSSRLSFTSAVVQNYRITPLGNTFDFSLLQLLYGDNYAIDNGYIILLYNFGYIVLALYLAVTIFLMKKTIKKENYNVTLMILTISFWGIYQSILMVPSLNFILLLWGKLFTEKKNVHES